jgi:hypothetical protein
VTTSLLIILLRVNIDWMRIELLHRELMTGEREYIVMWGMNNVTKK